MTDFFIKNTPIPLPRPLIEEIIPGGVNPGIKLDIPFPEMADIDLSFPLVGTNWLLHPFREMKQGWAEFVFYPWTEVVFFGGVLVFIGAFAAGLELLLRKIWK